MTMMKPKATSYNITYPKNGVSNLADIFVIEESAVLRINNCAEKTSLSESKKRCI